RRHYLHAADVSSRTHGRYPPKGGSVKTLPPARARHDTQGMTNRAKESNTADASYPSRARGASGETGPSVGSVTGTDRLRQVIVSISAAVAVLGALIGSGVFGGEPMPEASGGAFAADATPIAPGGPAFSIWSVIYAGLVAYAVWQWF